MLRPSKHAHPDRTVIFAAMVMLSRLRVRRHDAYADLKAHVRKTVIGGETLFLPSLNFLFLLGLVDYHPKTDAIEYVGPNEGL